MITHIAQAKRLSKEESDELEALLLGWNYILETPATRGELDIYRIWTDTAKTLAITWGGESSLCFNNLGIFFDLDYDITPEQWDRIADGKRVRV